MTSPAAIPSQEPDLSRAAMRRWGDYWRTLAIGWLGLLMMTTTAGWLITGPLAGSTVVRWDQRIPKEWATDRTTSWNGLTGLTSSLADTLTIVVATLALLGVLLYVRRWVSALLLTTSMILESSVFMLTTLLIARERPVVDKLDISPPTSSFPSGHTAAGVALYAAVTVIVVWSVRSRMSHVVVWLVAGGVVTAVALSRLYRGMHHPSDVAMGLTLGLGCIAVAYLAVRQWTGGATQHAARRGQRQSINTESVS